MVFLTQVTKFGRGFDSGSFEEFICSFARIRMGPWVRLLLFEDFNITRRSSARVALSKNRDGC